MTGHGRPIPNCPHCTTRICHRCETILVLLEHLAEYEATNYLSGNRTADGGIPHLDPISKHPSVRKLYRAINELHHADRTAWAHLTAYYTSEYRTADIQVKRRDKKGRSITITERQRLRIINGWILTEPRTRGETWIRLNYPGEPYLPDELRELVA